MSRRFYRNGQATNLAFPVTALDTTIVVNSATSFPTQYPYTLILEPDGALEEVVDVTNGAGTTLTVVRGADGTTASPHSSGVQVYHGVSARDADEANAHVNANANVHGISGAFVDTASSQAITGTKNFSALQVGGSAVVTAGGSQTLSGSNTFSGASTFSGTETHSNTETHSGSETHTGAETHSGTETHTGTVAFSNAVMRPVQVFSTTDEGPSPATTFQSGSAPVGVVFTAPPSGAVKITMRAYFCQNNNGQATIVSFGVRTGNTIGSGASVPDANNQSGDPNSDRALVCGRSVTSSQTALLQSSLGPVLWSGLTPGNQYNVRIEYQTTSGGEFQIFNRGILVEPVF